MLFEPRQPRHPEHHLARWSVDGSEKSRFVGNELRTQTCSRQSYCNADARSDHHWQPCMQAVNCLVQFCHRFPDVFLWQALPRWSAGRLLTHQSS